MSIFKIPLVVIDPSLPLNYGELYMVFVNIGLLCGLAKAEIFEEFNYFGDYVFHHFLIFGYIAGWIGIGVNGVMNVGGRHGMTAFLACFVYIIILQIIYCFSKGGKKVIENDVNNKDKKINEVTKYENISAVDKKEIDKKGNIEIQAL